MQDLNTILSVLLSNQFNVEANRIQQYLRKNHPVKNFERLSNLMRITNTYAIFDFTFVQDVRRISITLRIIAKNNQITCTHF